VQRRRVGEAGDADEARLLRLNMEAQAQVIQGVERTRVLGDELLQAKARAAQLAAELKMREAALRSIIESKDAVIQSKDDQLQSKDIIVQSKDALLQAKDLLLQAKDSQLRVLHADIARLNAGCAAGGAARQPAPSPPAQGEALFKDSGCTVSSASSKRRGAGGGRRCCSTRPRTRIFRICCFGGDQAWPWT
jgi:uncharacterized protein (DUF3084 family)